MELISNHFAGYFTGVELHALDNAERIPGIRKHVDSIRLMRISNIVIESILDDQITSDRPIELHSYGKLPDDVQPQYPHTNNADIGTLDYHRIDSDWTMEMTISVDREKSNDDQAPNLTKPEFVRYIDLTIIPLSRSQEEFPKLLQDVLQIGNPQLSFARKHYYDEYWQPLNSTMPHSEQVEVMLLLGKIANVDLPHK